LAEGEFGGEAVNIAWVGVVLGRGTLKWDRRFHDCFGRQEVVLVRSGVLAKSLLKCVEVRGVFVRFFVRSDSSSPSKYFAGRRVCELISPSISP